MVIIGGTNGKYLVDVQILDLYENTWLYCHHPHNNSERITERARHTAVTIDGRIFMFGGYGPKSKQLGDLYSLTIESTGAF
ncbi:MAG: hypothetical protein H0V43_14230 [Gemmatimonadales bacterium]|nr:hypothetical protein [Gemmatimonadales bacterium]